MKSKSPGRNDLCLCGSGQKYKRCCLNKTVKECFGDQGGAPLHGEPPEKCLTCDLNTFERCHKISIATSLQGISLDLSLLMENGLEKGWLAAFKELSESRDKED